MKFMFRLLLAVVIISLPIAVEAQIELSAWQRNTTGVKGYDGIIANVDSVMYSDSSVYVRAAGIPSYSIGPWPGDPNVPADQHYLYRFPRYPFAGGGAKVPTPLGAIGMLVNGVPVYNARDANSYNNQNIWHSNAVVVEGGGFDSTGGHADQFGRYHYHEGPKELYSNDSTKPSPLLGFAFDGYPIYGPYAYKNSDGSGGVVRMTSSYKLDTATSRTNGPAVSSQYPIGYYVEDYEYVSGLGTLDQYNGRFAVTPDYPKGTYAYYITIDSTGKPAYPYIIGPDYYGVPARDDFGTSQVTISEQVTTYNGTNTAVRTGTNLLPRSPILLQNYPNPFNPGTMINYQLPMVSHVTLKIYDVLGREVALLVNGVQKPGRYEVRFDGSRLPSGVYFYRLQAGRYTATKKLVLLK